MNQSSTQTQQFGQIKQQRGGAAFSFEKNTELTQNQSCDVQVQQHFDLQQKTLFKYVL